ncbi:hypothetical protein [Endozoicomonas sp. ONNA1]|uniref:hypothetical protein n=1 Tax=Endozoicomonas sp. ONNA1 TaxID=2828740 RepID=UPI002148CBDE|nr:hypothetical protein [Endozoicomonas sp. ONNA1]
MFYYPNDLECTSVNRDKDIRQLSQSPFLYEVFVNNDTLLTIYSGEKIANTLPTLGERFITNTMIDTGEPVNLINIDKIKSQARNRMIFDATQTLVYNLHIKDRFVEVDECHAFPLWLPRPTEAAESLAEIVKEKGGPTFIHFYENILEDPGYAEGELMYLGVKSEIYLKGLEMGCLDKMYEKEHLFLLTLNSVWKSLKINRYQSIVDKVLTAAKGII